MDSEAVACEDPEQSQSFHSRSYVVGELLTEPTLRAWLAGAAIPTWKPERGGGTS